MTTFYFISFKDFTKEKVALIENEKVIVFRKESNAKIRASKLFGGNTNAEVESIEVAEDSEFDLYFTLGD